MLNFRPEGSSQVYFLPGEVPPPTEPPPPTNVDPPRDVPPTPPPPTAMVPPEIDHIVDQFFQTPLGFVPFNANIVFAVPVAPKPPELYGGPSSSGTNDIGQG